KSGAANVGLDAERVRGSHPFFQGLLAQFRGSADVARDGGGASLVRGGLVARDEQGRDMFQADMGRAGASPTAPVRLTLKAPGLEHLAPLWPSVPRQVVGSGTAELESPDLGFSTYTGRVTLQVASAELLDGRLSVRDLSADVPLRRGGSPTAGVATH